uniref:DDE_Tnp_1_7 domain-containing protein n=1 Tax=Glossina austeni TaxID=7395 RepID=A0A1A9VP46_GLOAU
MISTIHNADMIDSNKIDRNTQLFIKKPHCIIDYNQDMNGVDLADQYLAYNPIFRKTLKWTKKIFFYLLHCAIFNSFRIYQILNSQSEIRFHDFMLSLAESWIEETPDILHSNTEEATNEPSTSTRTPRFDSTKRLSGNIKHHELVKILNNEVICEFKIRTDMSKCEISEFSLRNSCARRCNILLDECLFRIAEVYPRFKNEHEDVNNDQLSFFENVIL